MRDKPAYPAALAENPLVMQTRKQASITTATRVLQAVRVHRVAAAVAARVDMPARLMESCFCATEQSRVTMASTIS